jgi:hypothetical protein
VTVNTEYSIHSDANLTIESIYGIMRYLGFRTIPDGIQTLNLSTTS